MLTGAIITSLFGVACLIILLPIARSLGWVDRPGGRKTHLGEIPLIGGVVLFLTVLSGFLSQGDFELLPITLLVFSFLILAMGIVDDVIGINWRYRLIFQILCTIGVIFLTDLQVNTIGSIIGESQIMTGYLAIPVTLLAVVGLTNAFNMIDGYDGFAAIAAFSAILGICLFEKNIFFKNPLVLFLFIGLIIVIASNLSQSLSLKIFLGDSGSTFIGFLLAWIMILESQQPTGNLPPEAAPWCVAVLVFDFMRVLVTRMSNRRSIVSPDRSHIHHNLEKIFGTRKAIIISFAAINFVVVLTGFFLVMTIPEIATLIFLLATALFFLVLNFVAQKR